MYGVIKRLRNIYCNKEIIKNYEFLVEYGIYIKIDRFWLIL